MPRRAAVLALLLSTRADPQTFSGFAETKGAAYFDRTAEREPWVLGGATLVSKLEAHAGRVQLTASVRAEEISSNERGPLVFDPADRELRRSPLSLREVWVRAPLGPSLDLQLGRFELGWGKTDGYSPADAFLPRDLSDPFADEKLPIWGARLTGQRGPVRAELVLSATTTPWRLPDLSGRNAPLTAAAILAPVYLVDGTSDPPREGFGALRLLGTFGDWDVGLWGRTGVRPAPLLTLRTDRPEFRPDGIAIAADRRFVHEEGVGLEVSRVVGAYVLRAEAAGLFSKDAELGEALLYTLGLERAFGDGTLLVTFAANARGTPVDPALLFDRAFLPGLVVVWTRSERWGDWRIVATEAFCHGDGFLKAEVSDNLTDVWKITLGAELPFGSRYGPFGARDASRRVRLALRRSW